MPRVSDEGYRGAILSLRHMLEEQLLKGVRGYDQLVQAVEDSDKDFKMCKEMKVTAWAIAVLVQEDFNNPRHKQKK
jgi:hypothetical protein